MSQNKSEDIKTLKSVSIIGSCHSRDIFNKNFVTDKYKKHYKIYSYYTMTSLLSLMSASVSYNYNNLEKSGMKANDIQHWYEELEKNIRVTFESEKPDIVLLDFYADARYGAIQYQDGYIVKRYGKLKGKKVISGKSLGISYNYCTNTEEFFALWKKSTDNFMAFINKKLPQSRVILNTVKGTNIVDRDGFKYLSPEIVDLDVDKVNELWNRMDQYLLEHYQVDSLVFERDYFLNENYIFGGLGQAMVHFEPDYYIDCLDKLIDITSTYSIDNPSLEPVNLIIDSEFKNGLSCWTNVVGRFKVIENEGYNSIMVKDCREKLGDNYKPQIWSKPIKVLDTDAAEYMLCFKIKIPNAKRFSETSMIFAIREYKYCGEIGWGKCLDQIVVTVGDRVIEENTQMLYSVKFKSKGKYIRVAPMLKKYIPGIEYSDITLNRIR